MTKFTRPKSQPRANDKIELEKFHVKVPSCEWPWNFQEEKMKFDRNFQGKFYDTRSGARDGAKTFAKFKFPRRTGNLFFFE